MPRRPARRLCRPGNRRKSGPDRTGHPSPPKGAPRPSGPGRTTPAVPPFHTHSLCLAPVRADAKRVLPLARQTAGGPCACRGSAPAPLLPKGVRRFRLRNRGSGPICAKPFRTRRKTPAAAGRGFWNASSRETAKIRVVADCETPRCPDRATIAVPALCDSGPIAAITGDWRGRVSSRGGSRRIAVTNPPHCRCGPCPGAGRASGPIYRTATLPDIQPARSSRQDRRQTVRIAARGSRLTGSAAPHARRPASPSRCRPAVAAGWPGKRRGQSLARSTYELSSVLMTTRIPGPMWGGTITRRPPVVVAGL